MCVLRFVNVCAAVIVLCVALYVPKRALYTHKIPVSIRKSLLYISRRALDVRECVITGFCVAVCCSVLLCVAVRCSVLQCVAEYYSVLPCVAVWTLG